MIHAQSSMVNCFAVPLKEKHAHCIDQVAKDKHIQQVKEDRYFHGMRIMEARQYPEDLWSMVIDGSDASKWGIPHPAIKTHESQKGKKLQCKVYGVIVHGHFAACYVLNSHLPGEQTSLLSACIELSYTYPPKANGFLDA